MNKIIVEVFVPALGKSYDIFIPENIPMYEVLELIKKAITDLNSEVFKADENTAFCYHDDGTIININLSAYELGIRNGSRLMLI